MSECVALLTWHSSFLQTPEEPYYLASTCRSTLENTKNDRVKFALADQHIDVHRSYGTLEAPCPFSAWHLPSVFTRAQ